MLTLDDAWIVCMHVHTSVQVYVWDRLEYRTLCEYAVCHTLLTILVLENSYLSVWGRGALSGVGWVPGYIGCSGGDRWVTMDTHQTQHPDSQHTRWVTHLPNLP